MGFNSGFKGLTLFAATFCLPLNSLVSLSLSLSLSETYLNRAGCKPWQFLCLLHALSLLVSWVSSERKLFDDFEYCVRWTRPWAVCSVLSCNLMDSLVKATAFYKINPPGFDKFRTQVTAVPTNPVLGKYQAILNISRTGRVALM